MDRPSSMSIARGIDVTFGGPVVLGAVYRKILIGFQDDERGRDARALGRALGLASGAEPELITLGAGDDDLAAAAREGEADLVVLGSTHRGPVGRLVPGATVAHLLAAAPCAVAVAPPGFGSAEQSAWRPLAGEGDDSGMRVVGVGFDGSEASRQALRTATELALANGAALRVYTVARKIPQVRAVEANGQTVVSPTEAAALRELLERAVAELPASARALPVFLRGMTATELVRATATGVDLLVLGSRRGGPIRRAMHGSVTETVMREAGVPVLISPSGVEAPHAVAP